jgi:hypothetical protein
MWYAMGRPSRGCERKEGSREFSSLKVDTDLDFIKCFEDDLRRHENANDR